MPAERLFNYQAKPQGTDYGTVVITRDTGFVGADVAVTVSVDGKQAAALRTDERVTLYVPAGKHIMSDSQMGNTRHDHELIVKAGQVKFYRISVDSSSTSTLLTPHCRIRAPPRRSADCRRYERPISLTACPEPF